MSNITFQFIASASEDDRVVFLTVLAHSAQAITPGVYSITDIEGPEAFTLLQTLNESPLIEYAIVPPDTDG